MINIKNDPQYIYKDDTLRCWFARPEDFPFILAICKRFRNFEFFYVPDNSLRDEIRKGNILVFDYNVFEAGYIWITFPRNGRSRINHVAVDEYLWRNKVGSKVVQVYEDVCNSRGMWSSYLSCNSNTPGHYFWPTVGWTPLFSKPAGRRKGENFIWGKILKCGQGVSVYDIKKESDYRFQSSITESKKQKKINQQHKEKQYD